MKRHTSIWLLAGAVLLTGAAGCYTPVLTPGSVTATSTAPTYTAAPGSETERTGQPATEAPPVATATRTFTAATIAPAVPVATQEGTVNGAPMPTPFDPVLQQVVTQAQKDLAGRLSIDSQQVTVVEVRSVVWPDGGLGCPQPGLAYTQVQVDGLLIRLQARGQIYEYHTGGARPPFLCDQGNRQP